VTSPLLATADANARALLVIEQETAREASELLREQTRELMAQLHRVWPGDDAPAAAKMAAIRSLDLSKYEFVASQAGFRIDAGVARAFDHGIGAALNQTVGPASRAAWEKRLETLEIQSSYLKKAGKELAQLKSGPMELGTKFNTGRWGLIPDPEFDIKTPNGVVHTRYKEGPAVEPSRELLDQTGVNRAVREQVTKARVLMRQADSLASVQQALTVAGASASRAERVATWATNAANSEAFRHAQTGINQERDLKSKLVRMWRAERDACLHCLAYQGHYAEQDTGFPSGLTFAAAPLHTGAVPDPPLHPYCRCEIVLVSLDRVGPVSDALKREAERSVLKGWSRPSESEKARVAAADRLVKRGTNLPASVQKSATTAVRRGHFATRDVPTGAVAVAKAPRVPRPDFATAEPDQIESWLRDQPRTPVYTEMLREQSGIDLSQQARNNLFYYQQSRFQAINTQLRAGNASKAVEKDARSLDGIYKKLPPTTQTMTVYRGVNNREFIDTLTPGKVLTDPAFMSTSLNEHAAELFRVRGDLTGTTMGGGSVLEIRVPAGSKALLMDAHTNHPKPGHEEVLLPRGTHLRIAEVKGNRIIAELVKDEHAPLTMRAPGQATKLPPYAQVKVVPNPHTTSEPANVVDVYLQSVKEYNKIHGLTGKARKQPDPKLLETLRTKYANRAEQAADERGGWLFSSDPDVRAFRIWSETYQGLNLQRQIERNMAAGQDPWLGIRKDKLDEFRKATWQQAGLKQSDYSLDDAKNDLHNAALRLHYHAQQAPIEPEPLWRGMRVDDISKWRPGYVFEADHTSWTRSENAATHYAAASMSGDFRQGRHGVIITMENAHGFRIDQYNTVDWDETITSGRYRVKSAQWVGSTYRIVVEELA
jgi:hypothetical protein